jgi:hypothetical protein
MVFKRHKATFVNPDITVESFESDYNVGKSIPFRDMMQLIESKRNKILSRA